MTLVEFVKYDAPYAAGERKDCTPGEAAKLVRSGVAVVALAERRPYPSTKTKAKAQKGGED